MKVYGNFLYYFCNYSVSLKLFKTKIGLGLMRISKRGQRQTKHHSMGGLPSQARMGLSGDNVHDDELSHKKYEEKKEEC